MMRKRAYIGAAASEVTAIDRFTIGHAAWGTMLGLAAVPWWLTLGQAVLWEIVENSIKDKFPRIFPDPRPDTLANSAVDVIACMAGWGAMRLLPPGPEPDIWRDS